MGVFRAGHISAHHPGVWRFAAAAVSTAPLALDAQLREEHLSSHLAAVRFPVSGGGIHMAHGWCLTGSGDSVIPPCSVLKTLESLSPAER